MTGGIRPYIEQFVRSVSPTDLESRPTRGQLVLLAAIALGVALVPLVLAYVQLGYSDDLYSFGGTEPEEHIERTLEHAVHDAGTAVAGEYTWNERNEAASVVRAELESTLQEVRRYGLDAGWVSTVSYNESRGEQWAATDCPGGPDRQFGPCTAADGVVLQERDGESHVLGVAFDVHVTSADSETRITVVIEARQA